MGRRRLARALPGTRQRSEGQALVEFSLTIPILLLLIFALIDLGRAVYIQNALSQATREGARWGSVQARSSTDVPGIEAYTEGLLPGLGGVAATATCVRPGVVVLTCRQGDTLQVQASLDVEMFTPIVAQLMSAAGFNPLPLASTSQVLVNN